MPRLQRRGFSLISNFFFAMRKNDKIKHRSLFLVVIEIKILCLFIFPAFARSFAIFCNLTYLIINA